MPCTSSEDAYGEKVDRCLYNAMSKFVVGVGVGIVAAAVMRYKPWPIILGAGIGTGMGISDCNYEFKSGSLSNVVKQSLEGKRKRLAFEAQKREVQTPVCEEAREMGRREKCAGVVGRASHIKYFDD